LKYLVKFLFKVSMVGSWRRSECMVGL